MSQSSDVPSTTSFLSLETDEVDQLPTIDLGEKEEFDLAAAALKKNEGLAVSPVSTIQRKAQDESIRNILAGVRYQGLCEDVSYVDDSLLKLIDAIRKGEVAFENHVIPPTILLLPVPVWDKERGVPQVLVSALDLLEDDPAVVNTSLEFLSKLPRFPRANYMAHCVKDGLSFEKKVNLIKALMVYLEEMTGVDTGAEEGLSVDFHEASLLLRDMQFSPPFPTLDTFHYPGRKIVIDDMKLMEFRARLCWYLQQKERASSGKISPASDIIKSVRFSTVPPGQIKRFSF
jgi:hypothetical protein